MHVFHWLIIYAYMFSMSYLLIMSTMKETQAQRPFLLENKETHVKLIVPSSFLFPDLWVRVSWMVLVSV